MSVHYAHVDARDIRPGDLLFDLQAQHLPSIGSMLTTRVAQCLLLVIGNLELEAPDVRKGATSWSSTIAGR